jgi:hypothetical protein
MYGIRRDGGKWGKPKLLFRSAIADISPRGDQFVSAAGPGDMCPDCPAGFYIVDSAGKKYSAVPLQRQMMERFQTAGVVIWAKSGAIYFSMTEKDGSSSIWRVDQKTGAAQPVLHLTDPDRQLYRGVFDVDSKHMYYIIGDRQSDIWTMELKKK